MSKSRNQKRSRHEFKRLVENAVNDVCRLPRPGLFFCVSEFFTKGFPIEEIHVLAALHFTSEGSPFCCGEPLCFLSCGDSWLEDIGNHVRRAMNLQHSLTVELEIKPIYHGDVEFHYGVLDDNSDNDW